MEPFEINSSNLPGILDSYQILDPTQLTSSQQSDRMIMAAVNSAPLLPNEPLPTSEIPSPSISNMAALGFLEDNRTSNSNGSDPITGAATAGSLVTPEFGDPLTAPSRTLAVDGEPTVASVNVRDFGAVGDGIADDTQAIQRAIDAIYSGGGGVVLFSPGTYVVTSVNIRDNITYQGYGATIKRPANQGKWTRTFTTLYTGEQDSGPLVIKGLTFDGNSQNQGSYRNYELEQAHLLFLAGNPVTPGKLKAVVEDSTFLNGVADGISVYTNVDVRANNNQAINVFRGGFVLTGGNSSAEVTNLTTSGNIDPTGIDIETDGQGYGGTWKVDVKLNGLNIGGKFDIAVRGGSTVLGNNIFADAPFNLFDRNSAMKFTNSTFKVGGADTYSNRILFPNDITFENCDIYVTRKESSNPSQFLGLDVWWQFNSNKRDQTLRFINSNFKVDGNVIPSDTTYAIYLRRDNPANNNNLVITGGSISSDFDAAIFRE
jgi:Pectate lyase superfamily protein